MPGLRHRLVHAALSALLACGSAPCLADERVVGTLAVTTDYVFRGISQTDGAAAVQAGATYRAARGWFIGAWASNVQAYPAHKRAVEADLYMGYGRPIGRDWGARISYTRYLYVDDPRPAPYDYGEVAVSLAYQDLFTATVSYQPDSKRFAASGYRYAENRPALGYEISGRWPLPGGIAITAGAGYYDLSQLFGSGYWSGSAGLSYVHGRLQLDLTRFSVDTTGRRLFGDATADGRWVADAVWRF